MKKLIADGAFFEGETAEQIISIGQACRIEFAGAYADEMRIILERYDRRTNGAAPVTDVKAKLEKFAKDTRQVQSIMRDWASNAPAAEIARSRVGQGLQADPGLQQMVARTTDFRRLESVFRRLADAAEVAIKKLPANTKGREGNEAIGDLLADGYRIFIAAGGKPKLRRAFEAAIRKAVGWRKDNTAVERLADRAARRRKKTQPAS